MSEHYQEVCQFGYVHGQCRCPNPNKATRRVPCTNLNHAPAIDSEPDDMVEFMAEVK